MDLQQFLALEKQRLQEDRARLLHITGKKVNNDNCAISELSNLNAVNSQTTVAEQTVQQACRNNANNADDELSHSIATYNSASNVFSDNDHYVSYFGMASSLPATADASNKSAHEFSSLENRSAEQDFSNMSAQQQQLCEQIKLPKPNKRRSKNADDMEQWVSDTFYSYFPAYNNEYQKRQTQLRERQLENEQQLLKHQMLIAQQQNKRKIHRNINNENSSSSSAAAANNRLQKTDLEIIVNNPNYAPPKAAAASSGGSTARSDSSTRQKLLQDLRHTNFSDGVQSKQLNAEINQARKKNYQRELLQQIEEKRRSIELLIAKEQKQEEDLTRRLQEQLKTIKLEEELEQEKLRAEKMRLETERNHLMRQKLLAKLENDSKLLNSKRDKNENNNKRMQNVETDADAEHNRARSRSMDNNRVYQYFSNSAQHEYRRGKPMPEQVKSADLEIAALDNIENECFHLSDKVCPLCDAPLKNYESCCLRCQKKLSLRLSKANAQQPAGLDMKADSFALACAKCQMLYQLCAECLAQSDVCRACYAKRNVCMNCRRTLCSQCLDEVANGRDVERTHVNEQTESEFRRAKATEASKPFEVLQLNYALNENEQAETEATAAVAAIDDDASTAELTITATTTASAAGNSSSQSNNFIFKEIHNNLADDNAAAKAATYSINIPKNSIFHADYDQSFKVLEHKAGNLDDNSSDDMENLQRMRKKTDSSLSRYLKNYGDLAVHKKRSKSESRNRSTQTTPNSLGRRDIVLHEEQQNLSMPLLREMPKMTRQQQQQQQQSINSSFVLKQNNAQRRIDNLHRRWEVPAVQKYSISQTDPPVLTQLGAIRKQLQADYLLESDV